MTNSADKVRITPLGALAFACGIASFYKLNIIGEIYASELALIPLALLAMAFGGVRLFKQKIFWMFVFTALTTLAGYVISDLVQGSSQQQYLRGWGRVALLMTDFIALASLTAQDRRNLWWFVLGMGVGGTVYLRLVTHTPISIWKFGYAEPLMLVAASISRFAPLKATSLIFTVLGLLSIRFDSRAQAALSLLFAALVWARAKRPNQAIENLAQYWKVILPVAAAAAVLSIGLASEDDYYAKRREQSDVGRSAGVEIGTWAILHSPFLGYGSWNENKELADLQYKALHGASASGGRGFAPHSQILQAWVEGGLLGAAFFIFYGYQLLRHLKYTTLNRPIDAYTLIFLYFLLFGLWHLAMSPFTAPHRLQIALGVTALTALALELKTRLPSGRTFPTETVAMRRDRVP